MRRLALILSDWFDCFRTRFGHQNYRATFKPKGAAKLVDKVLSIRSREQIIAIDEQKERRWSFLDLGGIKEFEVMPARAHWLPPLDGILQRSVEQRRWHLLTKLGGNKSDGFEKTLEVKT
jgi:hypothetical protein